MQREKDVPPGTTTERDPVDLVPGAVIDGRYRIVDLIGEGGMGQVFEGEHLDLRRKVAIKMLPAHIRNDAQLVKRFEREAHTLAAVSHPNIVVVTDYGVFEGLPYLVMERLEGTNLASLLERCELLTLDHAVALVRQILAGLGHAHARGLVHRDLKPGNVWIESHEDGEHVKLLDFGFAKFVEPDEGSALLTADGIVVGTLSYMSPEQASGAAIDHRSDLYACGVLLFEMLTGRRPFEGEPIDILRAHLASTPPTLRQARPDRVYPARVEAIVAKALAKKPADRFESASELAKALLDATAARDEEEPKTVVYEPRPPLALGLDDDATLLREPPSAPPPSPHPERTVALETQEIEPARIRPHRPPPPERKPAAPPRRPKGPVDRARVAALVAIAVVAVGAIAALRLAPWPFGADARPASSPAVAPPAAPEARVREAAPPADPWAVYRNDARLDRYRALVGRGGSLSRENVRELRAYEREHPRDPRVNLVLGVSFLNDRWFSDALEAFAEAHAKDARVAGSPELLEGLVRLVRYEATSARATDLVVTIFGARAVPRVEDEVAQASADGSDTARLEALLRRLQS